MKQLNSTSVDEDVKLDHLASQWCALASIMVCGRGGCGHGVYVCVHGVWVLLKQEVSVMAYKWGVPTSHHKNVL